MGYVRQTTGAARLSGQTVFSCLYKQLGSPICVRFHLSVSYLMISRLHGLCCFIPDSSFPYSYLSWAVLGTGFWVELCI